jgi:hypothetical protein
MDTVYPLNIQRGSSWAIHGLFPSIFDHGRGRAVLESYRQTGTYLTNVPVAIKVLPGIRQ